MRRLVAGAVGAIVVIVGARALLPTVPALAELAIAGGLGAGAYVAITAALRVPEARALVSPLRRHERQR